MTYQQITILGHAGSDAEIQYLRDGTAVANVSVAVSKTIGKGDAKETRTTWMKVVAWRELAEVLALTKKGARVLVVGETSSEGWIDKQDGTVRTKIVVTAHTFRFASSKADDREPERATAPRGSNLPLKGDDPFDDQDEIPF